jgi:hypothetical protein
VNKTDPDIGEAYATHLAALRQVRRSAKQAQKASGVSRRNLTKAERQVVLQKTGSRCHICGGLIDGPWQADHVLSFSAGGKHSADNYLAAHDICNNYRWNYTFAEFQEILKLGVWVRTQIERRTSVGRNIAFQFCNYDRRRAARRKSGIA